MLDYLDDLAADFRVFYRVDDFDELSGPQFLSLALRVSAYQGVLAARLSEQENGSNSSSRSSHQQEVREVEAKRESVMSDPVLAGVVSWGEG